ncbi:hypothetical protein [Virgisporangium aurantiacum]|uniref:hypothetical protein n=1 Tax=Virgisporangium aurantiacum TaxID=175570 RepID=UPI00194DC533|nr:hypothetical protein [Virgisporangium aurantiacum]
MTLVLLGAGAQAAAQLVVALGRWLTLRARAELTRAAAGLPPGVQISGRDSGGTWKVRRDAARGRR